MSKVAVTSAESPDSDSGFSSFEYNNVALHSTLLAIQLLRLEMDGNPEHYTRGKRLKLKFNRETLSCRYDDESKASAAIFRYNLAARVGRSKAFGCSAEYAVIYQVPDDATEAAASAFCRKVGQFAAYPYFRAVAAQMAWNAGLELPPLPSIAAMPVVPKRAAKEEAG